MTNSKKQYRLRANLSQIAINLRFDRVDFARLCCERNVDDSLIDITQQDLDARQAAALLLSQSCEGDESECDKVICLGVIAYLDAELDHSPENDAERRQRLVDCFREIRGGVSYPQAYQWVKSYYP